MRGAWYFWLAKFVLLAAFGGLLAGCGSPSDIYEAGFDADIGGCSASGTAADRYRCEADALIDQAKTTPANAAALRKGARKRMSVADALDRGDMTEPEAAAYLERSDP